jgi:hypothetical protein
MRNAVAAQSWQNSKAFQLLGPLTSEAHGWQLVHEPVEELQREALVLAHLPHARQRLQYCIYDTQAYIDDWNVSGATETLSVQHQISACAGVSISTLWRSDLCAC